MSDQPSKFDLRPHRLALNTALGRRCDWTVMDGLFRGLRLWDDRPEYWTMTGPALVGCFEREVQGLLQGWMDRPYDAFINVGAGEGLYLVGLGARLPRARLIGYETRPHAWPAIRELAALNGMGERIELHGTCTPEMLSEICGEFKRPLVLIDVEGAEVDFLQPEHVAALGHADLVVECHDGKRDGATRHVVGALRGSHHIQVAREGARDPNALPILREFRQIDRWLLMWEGRSIFCHWAAASSNAHSAG